MVTDNGGAPCVWRGLLSLAICKPMIRKSANEGDLILGFGGKSRFPEEPLIYIAKVTAKPKVGEYYKQPEFENRPDCIYENRNGKAARKESAMYHNQSDEINKDVGEDFGKAHVLLSNDFRYFGNLASDKYKKRFSLVKSLVENLKRGHRVNHSAELCEQLKCLVAETWQEYSQKQLGKPSDSDKCLVCNK